jgi:plastocyanin
MGKTLKYVDVTLISLWILTTFSLLSTMPYAKAQETTISIVPNASTMGSSSMMDQTAQPAGPYEPSSLLVKNGTTVTWENNDNVRHIITSGDPSSGPTGIFESEMIEPGGIFSYTFNTTGTFAYFDTIFPDMVPGTIVVSQNITEQDQTSRSEHDQPSRSEGNNMSSIGGLLKVG